MIDRDRHRQAPKQSRSQRLVELIVDTTAELLAEQGIAALSTNAVAQRAGISVGSVYRYFPNKGSIMDAVIERDGRRFHDRIRKGGRDTATTSSAEIVERAVAVAARAYRATSIDDSRHRVEWRRDGLFDRRVGAVTAVRLTLEEAAGALSRPEADVLFGTAAIVAEIVVALIEAASTRPSPALSVQTVATTATHAANAYLSSMMDRADVSNLNKFQDG